VERGRRVQRGEEAPRRPMAGKAPPGAARRAPQSYGPCGEEKDRGRRKQRRAGRKGRWRGRAVA